MASVLSPHESSDPWPAVFRERRQVTTGCNFHEQRQVVHNAIDSPYDPLTDFFDASPAMRSPCQAEEMKDFCKGTTPDDIDRPEAKELIRRRSWLQDHAVDDQAVDDQAELDPITRPGLTLGNPLTPHGLWTYLKASVWNFSIICRYQSLASGKRDDELDLTLAAITQMDETRTSPAHVRAAVKDPRHM
jgi:hypothetical protein